MTKTSYFWDPRIKGFFSLFFILSFLFITDTRANSVPETKFSLEKRQADVFRKMLKDPSNMDYMFDYALISIELSDLEGAITTLQRMLISNPNLPRVHMELGAAFFKLGSYNSAASSFKQVKASDDVPPEVLEKVDSFLAEIENRTDIHRFSGSVSGGIGFKTNANSAPGGTVQVLGINATNETPAAKDFYLENSLSFNHTIDMQNLNSDVWINNINAFTLNFDEQSASDIDLVMLKSGPRLSLDEKEYGTKLRPTLSTQLVQSNNRLLYYSFGIGFEIQDTFSKTLSLFSSSELQHKKHDTAKTQDGNYFNSSYGIALNRFQDVTIRGTVNYSRDDVRIASLKNHSIGSTMFVAYTYTSDLIGGYPWQVFGSMTGNAKFFDKPDSLVNSEVKRTDQEVRASLGNTFNLSTTTWATLDFDATWRDSNLPNFDLENYGIKLTLGYRF